MKLVQREKACVRIGFIRFARWDADLMRRLTNEKMDWAYHREFYGVSVSGGWWIGAWRMGRKQRSSGHEILNEKVFDSVTGERMVLMREIPSGRTIIQNYDAFKAGFKRKDPLG